MVYSSVVFFSHCENGCRFYEFLYDGTPGGTHFTLDELEKNISPRLNSPLLVYSPFPHECRVRVNKKDISEGKHRVYVGLVDADGKLKGNQSIVTFYNNPKLNNLSLIHI